MRQVYAHRSSQNVTGKFLKIHEKGHFFNHSFLPLQCLYECIFNEYKILVDSKPDPLNTRAMLEKLLGNNQDFLGAYLDGVMNCTDTVREMQKSRRPRHSGGAPDHCSPTALLYGICAQKYVFNNCPSSSWSGTESCELARLENLNCPSARASRGAGNRNR